jgi:hypothetical protein
MDDLTDSLTSDLSSLANVATTFGGGAIASSISGNPFYSQDPAAIGYATSTSSVKAAATDSSGIILLCIAAYFLLKG